MTFFEHAYLADKLERLLTYALEPEKCQKVFISGVCSHPDNSTLYMHTCKWAKHVPYLPHKCRCGKEWINAIPGR